MAEPITPTFIHLPERAVPTPAHLSPGAQALVEVKGFENLHDYPPLDDKAAWRAHIARGDQAVSAAIAADLPVDIEDRVVGDATIYVASPRGDALRHDGVVLTLHGGGLILCGGAICRAMAARMAMRMKAQVWAVDYRMPPDHPYPAALDDCIAGYRALLAERAPGDIVVEGNSAGGNLAAALVLRARDEGLPLPAGAILATPECDLTESGDTMHTNLGLDPALGWLMPANLLYADGHDLTHPYLSPLFGDFTKGFPPTILTTGTRDMFLSNTVRLHRALRAAGIPADLHVLEAGGHIGFPACPEGAEMEKEIQLFLRRCWMAQSSG